MGIPSGVLKRDRENALRARQERKEARRQERRERRKAAELFAQNEKGEPESPPPPLATRTQGEP